MNWKRWLWVLALGLLLGAPARGQAACAAFLKIDNVDGEATDFWHTNWIEVVSLTNTMARKAGLPPRGLTFRRSSLTVVKKLDKASPLLSRACATGQSLGLAKLECCNPLTPQVAFYELTLGNVLVKSLTQTATTMAGSTREEVVLGYDWITWTYTRTTLSTNLPAQRVASYWDLAHNHGGVLPLPFTVSIRQQPPDQVLLSWQPVPGRTYRIYSSPRLDGSFALLAEVTPTLNDLFSYSAPLLNDTLFFTVEEKQ